MLGPKIDGQDAEMFMMNLYNRKLNGEDSFTTVKRWSHTKQNILLKLSLSLSTISLTYVSSYLSVIFYLNSFFFLTV